MSRFLKILSWILGLLLLLGVCTITTVDRSPIGEQDFYHQTFEHLDNSPWQGSEGVVWLAGWAKANVTPDQPVPLVGYAPRGPYELSLIHI